ncbi:AraC family transcriptional regulator [Anaerobacterium chartisolvens]|uniref:AraC family transcriptional regulator n=1 Tax=Anaerobacterium chartisolvens TaxID=1297424 RepID=A0A369BI23_9FIRM|nr:AraC family transcriptional regulator [Anaerobacterium chartisolvens]RCX19334.1 AraC family transcriptional regulator [Anaerobacterium chartisolvens]
MEWMESISRAIGYIEDHITQEISIDSIARQVNISPFYFQKGFSLLCGFTVTEYIRKRRLALAGSELVSTDAKVIDIALKYSYDSPDSFTKAFTRFHGITPAMVRKDCVTLKSFAPLKIKISLEGGYLMDYKIMQKDSFTVIGASRMFTYDNAKAEIPKFWKEHYAADNGKYICGMYGINYDESMAGDVFEYLIADNYNPAVDIPDGFITKVIPSHTWAVFPCKGAMPKALQDVNNKIFSEWLPACKEYEIAAGYCIEMYEDASKYPGGIQDDNYYSEMWIPVRAKR